MNFSDEFIRKMILFFIFTQLICSLNICIINNTSTDNEECALEDPILVDAKDFQQRNFSEICELHVFICIRSFTVDVKNISKIDNIVFTANSRETHLFLLSAIENTTIPNIYFGKLTVHILNNSISFGKLTILNVIFEENTIINARSVISKIGALSGVSLLNASTEVVMNIDFEYYVQSRTVLTIDSPRLYVSSLSDDTLITFAGQSLRIASTLNTSKVFEFFPCGKRIQCTVRNIIKPITISIVNLFTSAIFTGFILNFEVSSPVNFHFMKSSWEGFYLYPIQIYLRYDCNFTLETDYVPMLITANNSIIQFKMRTESFRMSQLFYLENTIVHVINEYKKPAICSFNRAIFKGRNAMFMNEIESHFESIFISTTSLCEILGDIHVKQLCLNKGEAHFSKITLPKDHVLEVNYQESKLNAYSIKSTETKEITLVLIGKRNFTGIIKQRDVLSITIHDSDCRITPKFEFPNYACNGTTFYMNHRISAEVLDLEISVYSQENKLMRIIDDSICLTEKESYTVMCPQKSTIFDFTSYHKPVFDFSDLMSANSVDMTIYVYGAIPYEIAGLSESYSSINIYGKSKEFSSIKVNDSNWSKIALQDITINFVSEETKRFNEITVQSSATKGIEDSIIEKLNIELDQIPSFHNCTIKSMNIYCDEKEFDIVSNNDSIVINGIVLPYTQCTFNSDDNINISLRIDGDAIKTCNFSFTECAVINISCSYQIDTLHLPINSEARFITTDVVPKNIYLDGCLHVDNFQVMKLDSLMLDTDAQIKSDLFMDIFVKKLELNRVYDYPLTERIRVHSDYVLIANSTEIETTIYDAKIYEIEPISIVTINVPNEDRIKDINFTIKYQMGSVPSITFHGTREVESVHLDMYNTGSSYQLLTDQGWNDVEVGVISIDNISSSCKIDTYFRSMSWAFQQETRVFDLILTKTRDYKNKTIYSIVKMNKTIDEDESNQKPSGNYAVLISIIASVCAITIIIIVIVAVIRKNYMKKRVERFTSETLSQNILIEPSAI